MKEKLKLAIKPCLADRGYLSLMIGILVAGLIYVIFTLLTIHSSDIQVVVHYSAFGDSHFYKNQWYYLYSFTIFGVFLILAHLSIMVKLYGYERRQTGLIFGWLTILLLVIAFIFFKSVTQLAFL